MEQEIPRKKHSFLKETLETLILALVLFFLIQASVQNFKVEGSSMKPSLSSGQYVLVNKLAYLHFPPKAARFLPFLKKDSLGRAYLFSPPKPGDIVVFSFPRDPSRDYIKRVIAIPGQVVEVRGGQVYVDGRRLVESYLETPADYTFPAQRIPENYYFVLGDNRVASSDSHVWGLVPYSNLVGKAWLVYWPFSSFGLAPNTHLQAAP